jgi:transcriptional regulator with XRE-family HTH domain
MECVPNKMSDAVEDLGSYLKEQRQFARMSLRQLASAAGVSNPYLSQIERGLRKPSAEVLQQLAKGLRISAEVLYVRAGILEGEANPGLELAVHTDPTLTERQKRVLLDIYATFRAENVRSTPDSAPEPASQPDPSPDTAAVRARGTSTTRAARGSTRSTRPPTATKPKAPRTSASGAK